jgi:carbon monoxide dehydrogenase subunit G
MIRSLLLAALTVVVISPAALAAQVTETVDTSAPPKAVWKVIGKFDAIADWLPGVASSPATKGSVVGSVRTITLKAPGNPTVVETLTARGGRSYSYTIDKVDPKVLPVTGYSSTISVVKTKTGSTVTWHGDFTPAGGADDAAADKAVSGLYRSGLDNIKALVEK